MIKIAFFDTKPYDKESFDKAITEDMEIQYYESKLNASSARMVEDCQVVCAFVNDVLDAKTIEVLYSKGIRLIAMRCAGYNNVDFKTAYDKINVVRVPAYSPYAVAEHAMALLLTLNRKIHKAYNRTREHNFSIAGLEGFDLHGKTLGVIGTGNIGRIFINICRGFGLNVLAYDPYPVKDSDINYVTMEQLFTESDVISLHCPLTNDTKYIINKQSIEKMKKGVVIINTSRGSLIDSSALLEGLQQGQIKAAGLDVYEEESELFFEDYSNTVIKDDVLSLLTSMPNVIITSHQAFLTQEALENIASTTVGNISAFFEGSALENEICYHCKSGTKGQDCNKDKNGRCF